MREIKFRGKRTLDGKWVYGYLMNMHNSKRLFIGKWRNIGGEATIKDELFSSYVEVDPETVGQLIGLPDKNGKEIYVGDILRINDEPDDNVDSVDDITNIRWLKGFIERQRPVEIIGNVFENKELLGG